MQLHVILVNRYKVAAKLGLGASAAVWLAKDLPPHKHRIRPNEF